MQTFLPSKSFKRCARVLDRQRCGKQRVEAWQIYQILIGQSHAWKNHPIVKMWRGYEKALALYYNSFLEEWQRRGYRNIKLEPIPVRGRIKMPPWIGMRKLHSSHRAALLAKNNAHYSQFGWKEQPVINYHWVR